MAERVFVGESSPRRLLRILSRRQQGGFTVLELAPQRRRCHQGGCTRLVDVPGSYCLEHRQGDA